MSDVLEFYDSQKYDILRYLRATDRIFTKVYSWTDEASNMAFGLVHVAHAV